MDVSPLFLSSEAVGRVQHAGYLWLASWQKLAELADLKNEALFKILPKHHYIMQFKISFKAYNIQIVQAVLTFLSFELLWVWLSMYVWQ